MKSVTIPCAETRHQPQVWAMPCERQALASYCFQPSTQVSDTHSTWGRYCCDVHKQGEQWQMLLPLAWSASAQAPLKVDVLLG